MSTSWSCVLSLKENENSCSEPQIYSRCRNKLPSDSTISQWFRFTWRWTTVWCSEERKQENNWSTPHPMLEFAAEKLTESYSCDVLSSTSYFSREVASLRTSCSEVTVTEVESTLIVRGITSCGGGGGSYTDIKLFVNFYIFLSICGIYISFSNYLIYRRIHAQLHAHLIEGEGRRAPTQFSIPRNI